MRILAPYFGNTIYTTSGTITIILLALSIGYKVGGTLADKYNSPVFFYGLICISGILTGLSHLFMGFLLPSLSLLLPLDTGPLLAGILFMLVPNILFGMLSPFAIKLQTTQIAKTGNVAGSTYFWSTLGSITGSLVSTFYLIPYLGLDASLRLSYIVVLFLGAFGLLLHKKKSKVIIAGIVIAMISSQAQTFPARAANHIIEGVYEKILVTDITYKGRPTRVLTQNTNSSAATFLDGSDLVFDYTKYVELTPAFLTFTPTSALSLGAGAYSVPKWLHQTYPNLQNDVVEIEPKLEAVSKQYFSLPTTPLISTYVDDGRHFLAHTDKKYDLVFVDMYSSRLGVPSHAATTEFFTLLKSRTNPSGVIIMNLIGNLSDPTSPALSQLRTITSVFPNLYVFGVSSATENTRQNIMVFIGPPPNTQHPLWKEYASHLVPPSAIDLHNQPLLTDDLNPIDLLYAKSI